EEQMQICPQNFSIHVMDEMEHVMVIAPVDAEEDEAENVGEEEREERLECAQISAVRHVQLEDHDGDEDGDHAVAEGFEARACHAASVRCRSEHERGNW